MFGWNDLFILEKGVENDYIVGAELKLCNYISNRNFNNENRKQYNVRNTISMYTSVLKLDHSLVHTVLCELVSSISSAS